MAVIPQPVKAPSNISGGQGINDFGLMYELFNTVNWSASTSTGVTGYNVYLNGELVATVGPSVLSYTDRNIAQGVSNTYSVIAFNSYGIKSSPISITIN